jgi:phosphoadenosine phosphosulfate reductase
MNPPAQRPDPKIMLLEIQEPSQQSVLSELVEDAIYLLREHEPQDGYQLMFSGGKDSVACKKLLQLAGVKFDSTYSNTTIDPPELVRFIKKHHPEVKWRHPEVPMMVAVATLPKVPPTRMGRWCCDIYKEQTGDPNRVKVIGVRAAESKARQKRWDEISKFRDGSKVVCPIVFWSDAQVWEFIRAYDVPYCSLYDEGFTRLGCVGCPLASKERQSAEFKRWPAYERNWKKAVIANWLKWKDIPRKKDGLPRYHAKFKTGEDFWRWWRYHEVPKGVGEYCQGDLLLTNESAEK